MTDKRLISQYEIAQAWRLYQTRKAMAPSHDEFDSGARQYIGNIALDHEKHLKHEHVMGRSGKRFHMRTWHAIGEGIGIGIKIGLAVARIRAATLVARIEAEDIEEEHAHGTTD